jgi:MoaA/NifB/PqqE/SkfB family radical SAM enzyme
MLLDIKLLNKIKYIGNRTKALDLYRFVRKEYGHFDNRRRYKRIRNNGIEYPSKFNFKLTNRCNLNCEMCYQQNTKNIQEWTLKEIDKVFSNLGSHFKYVILTGGEIFLRKDLFDILGLLKDKYKTDCFLTTNGTLINEDVADRLARYTNINGMLLSLDGPRDVHNKLRGLEGAFDKTVNAIRLLKDRLRVYVNCVVHKMNIPHISELVRIVHESGIYNISFILPIISDKATMDATRKVLDMGECEFEVVESESNSYDFNYELFQTRMREAKKLGEKLGVSVVVTPNFSEPCLSKFYHNTLFHDKKMACKSMLWGKVNVNGDVMHCAYIKMAFGNLLESSFEDIWNSDKMRLFRKKLFENNLLPVCRRCACRTEII